MMDWREMFFFVRKVRLPQRTEMEATSTAITSVGTSGDEVSLHDGHSLGMPQEPAQKYERMRLWNQSDIGWNMGNQDDGEDYDYDYDYDKDYDADDEVEGDTLWLFWEAMYTEGLLISLSLQDEPSPKIPPCDVPRPTIELSTEWVA